MTTRLHGLAKDHSGKRFGRLTALRPSERRSNSHLMWECRCDCGNECTVIGIHLTRGATTSCGCFKAELLDERNVSHGLSDSPAYRSWLAMRTRCTNPSRAVWKLYGGRGIKVCDRWNTFENFLADMGPRPKGTSIDRIDSDGNYEPSNCRWATATTQARNTAKTKLTELLVLEIRGRMEHGESRASVARRMGIRPGHVTHIIQGRVWRDVQ